MAVTKTFAEVLTVAGLARRQEDDTASYIINLALKELWNAYDWRETLAELPPFYLIPGEQDYGSPFSIIPSDFRGLRKAYVVQTVSTPPNRRELAIIRDIRLTAALNLPTDIGYEPTTKTIRVFPRVPNNIGATDFLIEGTYKKRVPQMTNTGFNGTMIFDDEYFSVLVAGVKWASYALSDDGRADKKWVQFHQMIDEMASAEGLDLGDPSIAPAEPLVAPQNIYVPYLAI